MSAEAGVFQSQADPNSNLATHTHNRNENIQENANHTIVIEVLIKTEWQQIWTGWSALRKLNIYYPHANLDKTIVDGWCELNKQKPIAKMKWNKNDSIDQQHTLADKQTRTDTKWQWQINYDSMGMLIRWGRDLHRKPSPPENDINRLFGFHRVGFSMFIYSDGSWWQISGNCGELEKQFDELRSGINKVSKHPPFVRLHSSLDYAWFCRRKSRKIAEKGEVLQCRSTPKPWIWETAEMSHEPKLKQAESHSFSLRKKSHVIKLPIPSANRLLNISTVLRSACRHSFSFTDVAQVPPTSAKYLRRPPSTSAAILEALLPLASRYLRHSPPKSEGTCTLSLQTSTPPVFFVFYSQQISYVRYKLMTATWYHRLARPTKRKYKISHGNSPNMLE